jgi:hypothetical protein
MSVPYKVGKYGGVEEQMQMLLDRASLGGIRAYYTGALLEMARHLKNDPLEWGDPLYRKPALGGIVCHAVVSPIIVHYSVHEPAHTILIIEIKPLFEWPIRP